MIFPKIIEWDNFLSEQELAGVLAEAHSLTYNVKGVYQGLSSDIPASPAVIKLIVDRFSEKMNVYTHWKRHFGYRLSLQGETPGVFNGIHNDIDDSYCDRHMISMIMYLQGFRDDESMNFYKSEALSSVSFQPTLISSISSVKDQWEVYRSVKIKPNKLIAFSSALFHGVSSSQGFGVSVEDGRLILPLFLHLGFSELCHDIPEPDILKI